MFCSLVLSTLYISSSMIFVAPSPSLKYFGGLEAGYCKIQNHTLEAFLAMKLESGSDIWDQREEQILMGLDQVRQRAIGEGIEEEEMVEDMKMGGV